MTNTKDVNRISNNGVNIDKVLCGWVLYGRNPLNGKCIV